MAEETQTQETVEEVEQEQVDTQETTEQQQEEVVSKQTMKDRLDRKEKQHQKAYSELQENFNSLKNELEEIKLNSMPEKERKGYKQEQEEKKQKEYVAQLEAREKTLQTKEAAIQTKQELSEADIDSRFTDILLDTGVYANTEDKVAAFKDIYNEARDQYRAKDLKEALSGKSPKVNATGGALSKEKILSTKDAGERIRLIQQNPHLFKK